MHFLDDRFRWQLISHKAIKLFAQKYRAGSEFKLFLQSYFESGMVGMFAQEVTGLFLGPFLEGTLITVFYS